ncbi:MAG: hypothetical protein E7L00_06095 [Propionibacteriaceae bacterium]|nr:hypothetical protein [Propionibacteriaceae bacterium]
MSECDRITRQHVVGDTDQVAVIVEFVAVRALVVVHGAHASMMAGWIHDL